VFSRHPHPRGSAPRLVRRPDRAPSARGRPPRARVHGRRLRGRHGPGGAARRYGGAGPHPVGRPPWHTPGQRPHRAHGGGVARLLGSGAGRRRAALARALQRRGRRGRLRLEPAHRGTGGEGRVQREQRVPGPPRPGARERSDERFQGVRGRHRGAGRGAAPSRPHHAV
ncbi:MAG: hypothetical protein AVDCRST_MAG89-2237, partial [uncultured Gemmatimonadetes bacterium]